MIPKAEILAVAAEAGLLPTTVEKDYALGWVLFAIADHPDPSRWYFKGGTCLKKCFFDTYRFSEDLDFTVPEGGPYDGDAIRASLLAVADWVRDHSGIDFPVDGIHVAESINKRGRPTFEARMSFLGPLQLPRSARQRIRFDLTRDELIAEEAEEREVFHGYSDAIDPPPMVRCYSLSEILAEKVRALYERSGRARDVYDVVNVGRNLREELSPNKIAVLAAKKFLSVGAAKRSGERSPATIPPTRGDGDDCSGDRSRGRPGTGVHVRMARRNEAGAPCTAPADRVGVADRRRRPGRGAHRAADAAALRLERSGIIGDRFSIGGRGRVGGREPLRTAAWRRIKMLLGKRPEPVTLKPQDLAVTTHIASVDLIVHPEPGALVERRIELLEKQVEAHRKATDDLRAELLERLRSAAERADEEKVSITRRLAASENLVRDFATEGVRLEGLGLWWVGLGVVLQNLAGLVG